MCIFANIAIHLCDEISRDNADTSTDELDFPPLESRPHSHNVTPYEQQVFPVASNTRVKARGTGEAITMGTRPRPRVVADRSAISRSGLKAARGLLEFTCLCPDLIVVPLVINWKNICQTTILMFFVLRLWRLSIIATLHLRSLFQVTNSGYFALIKYGLKASLWENFMALEMQQQLIYDGGLQQRHHKNCML